MTALRCGRLQTRTTPGGQPVYSDLAIEDVSELAMVFKQPLRQTQARCAPLQTFGALISTRCHISTTCHAGGNGLSFAPNYIKKRNPVHMIVDSPGFENFGEGNGLEKHTQE